MTVGDIIKEQRLKNNLTLLEVANKIGVKEATMQRYESGEIKNIKHETIVNLAKIFGCTPSYLMGWEEIEKSPGDLSQKDQIEIDDYLESFEQELLAQKGLMFDGEPLSDESKRKLLDALRIGAEMAKREAKEKYTPKKYRK